MIQMGVSGWMFLLVPAYLGCPGSKAVKRSSSLLLLLVMWRVLQGDESFVFTDIALLFALFLWQISISTPKSPLKLCRLYLAVAVAVWLYSCSGLHVIIMLCTAEFDDAQNDVELSSEKPVSDKKVQLQFAHTLCQTVWLTM